jgi:hypothetical protein
MKHIIAIALVLATLAGGEARAAVDLTKIQRQIAQQPEYQKQPLYCLLVFGPQGQMHKWLALDGDDLYVDRNSNGDLTDDGEKFALRNTTRIHLGRVPDGENRMQDAHLQIERYAYGIRMRIDLGDHWTQFVGWDPSDRLSFSSQTEQAPIIHIGGALTFRWFNTPPVLTAGQNCRFFTSFGTPGVGKGTFAAVQVCNVPREARLTARIDYPNRDIEQPPIQTTINLAAD